MIIIKAVLIAALTVAILYLIDRAADIAAGGGRRKNKRLRIEEKEYAAAEKRDRRNL